MAEWHVTVFDRAGEMVNEGPFFGEHAADVLQDAARSLAAYGNAGRIDVRRVTPVVRTPTDEAIRHHGSDVLHHRTYDFLFDARADGFSWETIQWAFDAAKLKLQTDEYNRSLREPKPDYERATKQQVRALEMFWSGDYDHLTIAELRDQAEHGEVKGK